MDSVELDLFAPEEAPRVSVAPLAIDLFGGRLLVKMPKWDDGLADKLRRVGGSWSKQARGYLFPATPDALAAVMVQADSDLSSEVIRWISSGSPSLELDVAAVRERVSRVTPGADDLAAIARRMDEVLAGRTPHRPLPYQLVAAAHALRAGGRFLFADVMGLGKTVEALTWLACAGRDALPALIVCTASGRVNWAREARKWLPADWTVETVAAGADVWRPADVVILTYGLISTLGRKAEERRVTKLPSALRGVASADWQTVIADEAHRIANFDALQTKAVRRLGKKAPYFLALSATPIMTSPMNLHGVLRTIEPAFVGHKIDFGQRYCNAEYHQLPPPGREKPGSPVKRWWTYDGVSACDELRLILSAVSIRRTRLEVSTELPPLQRVLLPVDIDDKQYRGVLSNAEFELAAPGGDTPAAAMRAMMMLWQCIGLLKVGVAVDWTLDYLAGRSRPLVVFYHHRAVGDALAAALGAQAPNMRVGRIDGSVTGASRDSIVQDFQGGRLEVLLAATKAAGESITLTRACDALVVERQWTAYAEEQAEGRIDRHGQTEPTFATYLCGVLPRGRSVDEDMAELVDARRQIAGAVLDADAVQRAGMAVMMECAARILARREVDDVET